MRKFNVELDEVALHLFLKGLKKLPYEESVVAIHQIEAMLSTPEQAPEAQSEAPTEKEKK